MGNIENFNSEDLLVMAINCRHSAIILKNSSFSLFDNKRSQNHGLFLLYTAMEELQKGLFCLFSHYGIMRPQQLKPIFSNHATKIILFKTIFRNPNFYIKNSEFYLDGVLFRNLDLSKLANLDKSYYDQYMKERNQCLYVEPNSDGSSYNPCSNGMSIEQKKEKLIDQLSYLWGFFNTLWTNTFEGDLGNFDYYKLRPKDKPEEFNIRFSGSGHVNPRVNYYPDSVRERIRNLQD